MKSKLPWIVGIFLLLGSISSLIDSNPSFISCILFLIGGLFCLPPTQRLIENKSGITLTGWKKYTLIAILGIGGSILLPKENRQHSDSNESTQQEKMSQTISENQLIKKQKEKTDSIISEIKKEKDILTVDSIEFGTDSILKIYVKSKDDVDARYFDIEYGIMNIGSIKEIEVYKKEKLHSSFGEITQAKIDEFKKNYISGWDGSCKPVVDYIKDNMNDPESYEHDKTFVTPLINGNFEIKTVFRGKNAFGGTVRNSCYSEVSAKGTIVSFKME